MGKNTLPIEKGDINEYFERLKKPFSTAKQYFSQLTSDIQLYEVSHNFYKFYESIEDQDKDTVLNNLWRMKGCFETDLDVANRKLRSCKPPKNKAKHDKEEFTGFLENYTSCLSEVAKYQHIINIINTMLSNIDRFNQIQDAITKSEFSTATNELRNEIKTLRKNTKMFVLCCCIGSALVSIFVCLILARIYAPQPISVFVDDFKYVASTFVVGAIGFILKAVYDSIRKY